MRTAHGLAIAALLAALVACGGASESPLSDGGLELPDHTGALTIDMGGQWFLSNVHLIDARGVADPKSPDQRSQLTISGSGDQFLAVRFYDGTLGLFGPSGLLLNRPSLDTWLGKGTTIYRNHGDGRNLIYSFRAPLDGQGELLVDVVLGTVGTLEMIGRISIEQRGTLEDYRVVWQGNFGKITGFAP